MGRFNDSPGFLRGEREPVDQDVEVAIDAVFRRLLDANLFPPCFHLFGYQHGKGCLHALPHLRSWHCHHDRVIARDLYPAVETGLARLGGEQRAAAHAIALAGKPEAHAEEATPDDAADDRLAAAELHGAPPRIAAARCTARRMAL